MSEDLNTKVQVMANDINYIKEELREIKEFMRIVVNEKADKKEVEELKANQSKVVWIIITIVLTAIVGLVVKTGL